MSRARETLKRMATAAIEGATALGLVSLLERVGERPGLLRVLTYHRVDDPDASGDLHPGLLSATPDAFAEQMAHLAHHYHVISMEDLLEARRRKTTLPERSVLITFDDAYRDFGDRAWPVLRRLGLPATLFVPTAFPDSPGRLFWWDRLYDSVVNTSRGEDFDGPLGRASLATRSDRLRTFKVYREQVKTLPHEEAMEAVETTCDALGGQGGTPHVLGWDELRQLSREGVTLASHTREHPLMNRISPERMRAELRGSLDDLRREIGTAPPVFAYPAGGVSDEAVRILAEEGFELAFTTQRSIADLERNDWLRLQRIPVGGRTTRSLLRIQLSPWSTGWTAAAPRLQAARGGAR